jgi:hypothetical protein
MLLLNDTSSEDNETAFTGRQGEAAPSGDTRLVLMSVPCSSSTIIFETHSQAKNENGVEKVF